MTVDDYVLQACLPHLMNKLFFRGLHTVIQFKILFNRIHLIFAELGAAFHHL